MADFADLVTPVGEDEILETELALLEEQGFPVTGYQPGTVARTLLEAFANVLEELWFAVAQMARGATLSTAEGEWLDLIAESQYGDARQAATATVGVVRLTDAGGGPHVIAAGDVYVTTASGLRYRNITGGTLPASGFLDLSFRAEAVGAAYNVANGAITTLQTALSTVTVSNPAVGATGTWITTVGADQESDIALRTRLRAKWGTLSTGSPSSAYVYWALSQPTVTRAAVDSDNPDGPGSLRVYIDSAGAVASTQTYIDARAPVGTLVTVMAASTRTFSLSGTVYVEAAHIGTAPAAVESALAALGLEIQIGGSVYRAEVIERVMAQTGVVNFVLSDTFADIALGPDELATFDATGLSYVEAP